MIYDLKKWWKNRQAKHYLNHHWHLIADIILVLIILALGLTLIIISYYPQTKIVNEPISHVDKSPIATTTADKILLIKTSMTKSNIYAGETFIVKITLENNGQNDLNNLILSPQFLSKDFSVKQLEKVEASSTVTVKDHKLWLTKLVAGETKEFNIKVTLNNGTNSPRNIAWSIKATYQTDGQSYTSDYDCPDLKLITDLKPEAIAYYNSPFGDQLGSGPIPPKLGLPTNYWIFFEVNNQGNDLTNLTFSAKLPTGVTLSNHKTLSAGEFSYNESQKRLTWTVKEVSVKNGTYQIGFEVELLPLAKQLGTNPVLVNNISYLATDSYTGEKLSGKLPSIDTTLPQDTLNKGQGVVVK
ncbi:MAG: hypothetical protein WCK59_03245 [Candidatus Falkowbacteria bacterium]